VLGRVIETKVQLSRSKQRY